MDTTRHDKKRQRRERKKTNDREPSWHSSISQKQKPHRVEMKSSTYITIRTASSLSQIIAGEFAYTRGPLSLQCLKSRRRKLTNTGRLLWHPYYARRNLRSCRIVNLRSTFPFYLSLFSFSLFLPLSFSTSPRDTGHYFSADARTRPHRSVVIIRRCLFYRRLLLSLWDGFSESPSQLRPRRFVLCIVYCTYETWLRWTASILPYLSRVTVN